jgi:F-type H+-transporting ATPase subunit b
VLIAVATRTGNTVEVILRGAEGGEEESHSDVEPKDGPSPIVPELKELAWGSGAFIVFAVLMRLVLFPRVKKGMDARYTRVQTEREDADTTRAAARAEVAEYEAQLASVRAEANGRVDAARRTLEAERAERLTTVNAGINERRQAAMAAAEAERAAAQVDVEAAAADVVSRTVELAIGTQPAPDAVRAAVSASMTEGAAQ